MRRILTSISLAALLGCTPASRAEREYISVAALKESYGGYPRRITSQTDLRLWVNGTDRFGNFSGTLTAQDATGGIEIKVDCSQLFRYFPQRSVITVRCQGLWLGVTGGSAVLGVQSSSLWPTDFIPEEQIGMYIKCDTEAEPVTEPPRRVTIGELRPEWISTLVEFSQVQFVGREQGLTWGDAQSNTLRHIVDRQGDTLAVFVSRFAEFAGKPLPRGSGTIQGILNYYDGAYSLRPVWDRDAVMDSPLF